MIAQRLANFARLPFTRFLVAGGIAALVNISARLILSNFMSFGLAIVIAYLIGMSTAYVLMRLFVFAASGKHVAHEYLRFGIVNLFALVQVWLVSEGLVHLLMPAVGWTWQAETIAHTIGVLSPVATSYAGHKWFTFAKSPEIAQ
jgi:putative flippase GtrA